MEERKLQIWRDELVEVNQCEFEGGFKYGRNKISRDNS